MPALMPHHRPLLPLTLVTVAALAAGALAACGEPPPTTVRGHVIRLRMTEYRFSPQVIHAPAGRLTIRAHDDGVLAHNVKIERPESATGQQDPDAPAPKPLGGTESAQHGETVTTTLRLKPGTYRLVCTVSNHDNLGMNGTLVVR
jgi:plastocyanin